MIAEGIEILLAGSMLYFGGAAIFTKGIYTKLKNQEHAETKSLIENEGIYHVTTKEAAQKIIESQHLRSSNYWASYGNKKTFFFPGKPSFEAVRHNIRAHHYNYEITTIKVEPTKEEIDDIGVRSYSDGAVFFKGDYHFKNNAKVVPLVLDLNNEGLPYYREKTPKEIEAGTYVPSPELVSVIKLDKKVFTKLQGDLDALKMELKFINGGFAKLFKKAKIKLQRGMPAKSNVLEDTLELNNTEELTLEITKPLNIQSETTDELKKMKRKKKIIELLKLRQQVNDQIQSNYENNEEIDYGRSKLKSGLISTGLLVTLVWDAAFFLLLIMLKVIN